MTLFGEAGVGKSRLVAEFTGGLDGAVVLRGRCLPYGESVTIRPLAEVAKAHAGILETTRRRRRAGSSTPTSGRCSADGAGQIGEMLAASIGIDPDDGRLEGLPAR